jgi:phospholipase/lecithinase/hemolysin
MYWTFILLVGLSSTFAFQVNTNFGGLLGKRFLSAAIFGDSTSDTGNVFQLTNGTWPISPPNYYGRYCNGPNWADDLTVFLKYNFAYGSATTDNNFVKGYAKDNTVLVPGLLQQVQQYLSNFNLPFLLDNTVHIVWGGANDAIADPALAAQPQLIISSLMNSVTALLAGGAKNIIVFNQEPFQNIPQNAVLNQPLEFIQLTAYVNALTNASLQAIQAANPQAKIYLFDLHTLITNLFANPPPPVIHTSGYCWNVTGLTIQKYCDNPKQYFFVDTFHFSTPIQQKLAQAVGNFFKLGFTPSADNYFYSV